MIVLQLIFRRIFLLTLFLSLSLSFAYPCGGFYEREHSLVPWGTGYFYLVILAFVTYRLTDNPLYPLPFILGGFFIFVSSDLYNQEVSRLYTLIVIYSFINLFLYFYSLKHDNEKKYNAVTLFFILIPIAIFAFWLQSPFPIGIRPDFTDCYNNLTAMGESLEKFKTENGEYPKELSQLTPKYFKKLPRCIEGMKPDSPVGKYYMRTMGVNSGDYEYMVSTEFDSYTLYCRGNNHKYPDSPKYTNKNGIDPVLP